MSTWTSLNAILRDLSEAQGCEVPVDTVEAVADDDKPPVLNIKEETEEELFENCTTGEINVNSVPDLGLIQEMLTVVRNSSILHDEVEEMNAGNAISPQINVSEESENTKKNIDKVNSNKKKRNVALESIYETIGKEIVNDNTGKKVCGTNTDDLNIPDDSSREKMPTKCGDSDVNKNPKSPAKAMLACEPVNMFRKKSPLKKVAKAESKQTIEISNNIQQCSYKPSGLATEYYKKYVENASMIEDIGSDIWTQAEKKMKEIDEKRRLQAAKSRTKEQETELGKTLDVIKLGQHRHLLGGNCVVCTVTSSHGFRVNSTEVDDLSESPLPLFRH